MKPNWRYGFVPPGHRAIMVFLVLHAWSHPSGAWLSVQTMGKAVALVWRSSDSWKATACLAQVFDDCSTLEENCEAAFRVGEFLIEEGPPPDLLLSAEKSSLVRKEKGKAAANARWDRVGAVKKPTAKAQEVDKPDVKAGPAVDRALWDWTSTGYGHWSLVLTGTDVIFFCFLSGDDAWDLTRYWCPDGQEKELDDTVFSGASLRECFTAMEGMTKRPSGTWKKGEKQ